MLLSCVASCIPFPHHLLLVTLVCCCCRLAIVGGGYIAAEQACIYRNFGADVHMFFRGKHILAGKHAPFNNFPVCFAISQLSKSVVPVKSCTVLFWSPDCCSLYMQQLVSDLSDREVRHMPVLQLTPLHQGLFEDKTLTSSDDDLWWAVQFCWLHCS